MVKTSKELESIMAEVLIKFRDGERYQTLENKHDRKDVGMALKECVDYGYLTGVTVNQTESGNFAVDCCAIACVTLPGLKFIDVHAQAL